MSESVRESVYRKNSNHNRIARNHPWFGVCVCVRRMQKISSPFKSNQRTDTCLSCGRTKYSRTKTMIQIVQKRFHRPLGMYELLSSVPVLDFSKLMLFRSLFFLLACKQKERRSSCPWLTIFMHSVIPIVLHNILLKNY